MANVTKAGYSVPSLLWNLENVAVRNKDWDKLTLKKIRLGTLQLASHQGGVVFCDMRFERINVSWYTYV